MLADKDRIFTNIYGFQDWKLAGARARGQWNDTALHRTGRRRSGVALRLLDRTGPRGGAMTWLQLPDHVDTMQLFTMATAQGISFMPGALFSVGRLRHNEMQGGVSRGVFLIGIGICGKKGAGAFDMTIAYRFMEGG